MSKTFTKVALIILFMACLGIQAHADHMVGSDIYWKCLGGDTFSITIVDYRDCNGIPFVNTPFILTPVGNCPGVTSKTVSGAGSGGKDITPVCRKSCTRCTDLTCDFPLGIQQYFITATVVLDKGCCNYQISWDQCCRSAGITTGGTWKGYYITSLMNRCVPGSCDNSPYFTQPPVAIYCVNQCVVYNPGANDDDRDVNGEPDSLVYSLTEPLEPGPSAVPWTGSYNYKEPLAYAGFPGNPDGDFDPPKVCNGFHLDPVTGEIKFKAVKEDVTIIAIKIEEYRRDSLGKYIKIGEIRRDMQIMIIDCPDNHSPIVTGINGSTNTSAIFCADQTKCFNVKCFDQDSKDSVFLSWNSQIPGASFTTNNKAKKWPTGVFCWHPTKKDIRQAPYRFVVTAIDNACPVPGRTTRTFAITVIAPPEANYSATKKGCGIVVFKAVPSGGTSISSYLWLGEGSPGYGPLYSQNSSTSYQYTRAGTYHYTLTVTNARGCSTTYPDSIKIDPFVFISLPKDTVLCEKSPPISVTATFGLGNKPYSLSWDHSSSKTDNITVPILKDTFIVAHIKDANGCNNYDSMKIRMQKLPRPNIGPDQRGCWGHELNLNTGLKTKMAFTGWTKIKGADTVANYLHGDTVSVNDSGKYIVTVRDSFGCPGYDTVNVYYNPLVMILPLDTDVCLNDSVRLTAGIAGSDASIQWIDEIHQQVVGTGPTYKFKALNTTNGHRFLVVAKQTRYGLTCSDSGRKYVRVHNQPVVKLSLIDEHCIDDLPFALDNSVDKAHLGGTWYYSKNPSAIVTNYLYPSIIGAGSFYVHYRYADQFRCSSDDSALVNISNKPTVSAGVDTEICTGNGRYELTAHINRKGGTWTPLAGTPKAALEYSQQLDTVWFNPAKAGIDTVYGIIYKWTNLSTKAKCSNSDTVYLRVRTNPKVTISKVDSLCENDQPIQLNANPGGGIWAIMDKTNPAALTYDKLSDSYSFDPSKASGGAHKLSYTAYGDLWHKMCPTTDSIMVVVASKPNPDFTTEDKSWEYCADHPTVKLIPNGIYPSSGFSGRGTFMTGNQGYYDPSKGDTSNSEENKITFEVPYNQNKCKIFIDHTIIIDYKPVVVIDPSGKSQCEGVDSFNFNADIFNCTGFSWDAGPSGNPIINHPVSGNKTSIVYHPTQLELQQLQFTIKLKGWNKGKCDTAISVIPVKINPRPIPSYTADDTIGCEPLTVHFNSSYKMSNGSSVPPLRYDWDFGDGSTSVDKEPMHIFNVPAGQVQHKFPVTFKVTVNTGCSGLITKDIVVNGTPKPKIFANPQFTTIAMPEIQFDLDSNRSIGVLFNDPATTYYWIFGDGTKDHSELKMPKHTYTDTGTFWVKLYVTSSGCVGVDSIQVNIKPELIIFIPNVFKPNGKHGRGHGPGDNYFGRDENETFQPVISDFESFSMNVYNRWGELMYNTTDPLKGWDGKYKNVPAIEGVYVYVIKATGFSGRPYTFTGSVTLIR